MTSSKQFLLGAALVTATSCAASGPPARDPGPLPQPQAQSETDKRIAALPTAKLVKHDKLDKMSAAIADYFKRNPTQRAYVMTDKPLYQPGETIWFRADLRATSTLVGKGQMGMSAVLTSPRGAIVAQKHPGAGGVPERLQPPGRPGDHAVKP